MNYDISQFYKRKIFVKIGYQGDIGSNSEAAAKSFAIKLGFINVEFIPLISSARVADSLLKKEIDYGVVAIENSIGGIVQETKIAFENINTEIISIEILSIHHCVFKKSIDIPNDSLKYIASHPQALLQTKETRKKIVSDLKEKEIADTAIGALYLSTGEIDSDTAIICRKNAGEMYGLYLMYENIEDDNNNKTTFHLLKIKEK